MSDITKQQMDQFFEPIVGSPEAIKDFDARLRCNIGDMTRFPHDINPYVRLEHSVKEVVWETATLSKFDGGLVHRLVHAEGVSLRILRRAYETIEEIYRERPLVPQPRAQVEENIRRVGSNITTIAYGDAINGIINRYAWGNGVDPTNLPVEMEAVLIEIAGKRRAYPNADTFTKESFLVNEDEVGALDVRLRYPVRRPTEDGHGMCPATLARVEVGGQMRQPIHLFVGVIGSIVVDEIYAQRLSITDIPRQTEPAPPPQ